VSGGLCATRDYEILGSGRIKVDPVVSATHPTDHPKVEVVVKNEQVDQLLSNLTEKLLGGQGGKYLLKMFVMQ